MLVTQLKKGNIRRYKNSRTESRVFLESGGQKGSPAVLETAGLRGVKGEGRRSGTLKG